MGAKTGIAWTHATWNPLRGCTKVSRGCDRCYAMSVAYRFSGPGQPYEGLARLVNGRPAWTNKIALVPEHLEDPLRWGQPKRIFVNSMSDLFHPAVPDEYISAVFAIMALAPHHTFQILTKRPERMASWVMGGAEQTRAHVRYLVDQANRTAKAGGARTGIRRTLANLTPSPGAVTGLKSAAEALTPWPLPHVWLGTSVEDQDAANQRIPHLLTAPATVRFLSCEPLLGPVELYTDWLTGPLTPNDPGPNRAGSWWRRDQASGLHWVIIGGESGPQARPLAASWVDELIRQCVAADVKTFVKQTGTVWAREHGYADSKGSDPLEWPIYWRIQQFPATGGG